MNIIFFSGLPKAGKSVTLAAAYKLLRAQGSSFFLERICPDCEGIWTADSGRQDLARQEKNGLKAQGTFFSPGFVEAKVRSIQGLSRGFDIVLLDMGGIPSAENRRFVEAALTTGASVRAVIMRPKGSDAREWQEFWSTFDISPVEVETAFGSGGSGEFHDLVRGYAEQVLPHLTAGTAD